MHGKSQEMLAKKLDRDCDPLPIGRSIAENGYFVEEPLVVIEKNSDYVVVEGNRRLAALKFLLDDNFRILSKDREEWEKLAKRVKRESIQKVPAVVYKSREELAPMLGFRHIAGIQTWSPLSKAKYIDNIVTGLIERKGSEATFKEAAKTTGTYSEETVKNYYISYRAYLQAKDEFQIDVTKIEESFSLFFRIFARYTTMQKFVGVHELKDATPVKLRRPISPAYADKLEELVGYIYGTRETEPVIGESREMKELAEVLGNARALSHLRETRNLKEAHKIIEGEKPAVLGYLREASYFLSEALKTVSKHKKDPVIQKAVQDCYEKLSQILEHFPDLVRKKKEGEQLAQSS
ncbi:MAG: hypothetical protein QW835_03480 [Candidatus Hadarchaeum sp.]